MSYNSGLNPELVKTSLDDVLYPEYNFRGHTGNVDAVDSLFFKQESTDRGAVQEAEYQGPGAFEQHSEEAEVNQATVRTANKTTHTVLEYSKALKIPVSFMEDDLHNSISATIREAGENARNTRDKFTMDQTYGGGFGTATTPDGAALFSNSHTALNGETIDNLETGALSAANLETVIRSLVLQKKQDGEAGGHVPAGLLVPHVLFPDAMEITKSTLKSGTGNNDLNYFSEIYPGLQVGFSIFLDSTYNTATNADTSYYVVGRNHMIKRVERLGLETEIDPNTDDRYRRTYKMRYREVAFPATWQGAIASNGTA